MAIVGEVEDDSGIDWHQPVRRVDVCFLCAGRTGVKGQLTPLGRRQITSSIARYLAPREEQIVRCLYGGDPLTRQVAFMTGKLLSNQMALTANRAFGIADTIDKLKSDYEFRELDRKARLAGGTVADLARHWPSISSLHESVRLSVVELALSVVTSEDGQIVQTDNSRPPVIIVITHPWIAAAGSKDINIASRPLPSEGDMVLYPVIIDYDQNNCADHWIAPTTLYPCPLTSGK